MYLRRVFPVFDNVRAVWYHNKISSEREGLTKRSVINSGQAMLMGLSSPF